ncbi:hypothetical protein NY99_14710 [Xanthomonas phaseoli pv. phaseoli]|uniref:Uncharacterized protein n=4 Tax=Xanthomonas TaxID=338 RepID=A0A1T1NUR4_9XANT|nr:hypothetical protein A9D66_13705 [Xanthomonas citri pv. glycines str. 12-2]KGU54217.1 hypothetical protein NY99_14710 [Xanthomonas phaseoli pv. phaseoli]OEY90933.1 hypothetical protein BIY41_13730 [Xanthomonas citri pv. glycines]OOW66903.1 hypothetical protein Xmlh_18405 [Xanthomonas axonopodis pv. melhusii]OOW77850.1 hypothetical protein Xclt_19555 [Xanthomonas axonopodis pv. clitoriae]OOX12020.1 hypothetical protein Xcaj_11600 [Xanthomonas axonopodis pv. cajani]
MRGDPCIGRIPAAMRIDASAMPALDLSLQDNAATIAA